MGDESDELERVAGPLTEVEISVAGHTVSIKADGSIEDVVGYALGLFRDTAGYARRSSVGFDVNGSQVERATPPPAAGALEPFEDGRA